MVYLLIADS